MQGVIIDYMKDSFYWLTSDVMDFPFMISPFNIAGVVYFLLVLQLWYWGMQVVHNDVRVLVL